MEHVGQLIGTLFFLIFLHVAFYMAVQSYVKEKVIRAKLRSLIETRNVKTRVTPTERLTCRRAS